MTRLDTREIHTASRSDVGRVRSSNQDRCVELADDAGTRLLFVADGMGGHQGGEVAAQTAVEAFQRRFEAQPSGAAGFLREAFAAANAAIRDIGRDRPELDGMGTTGVALLLPAAGSAWVGHVGDSRAYRLRDGRLELLTTDHSWVRGEVEEQRLTPDEAERHPYRNVLLRSIGVEPNLEVDVSEVGAHPGDRFLLCSDGLWGEVSDDEIAAVLAGADAGAAAERLVDLALRAGGSDNVTVQVAILE